MLSAIWNTLWLIPAIALVGGVMGCAGNVTESASKPEVSGRAKQGLHVSDEVRASIGIATVPVQSEIVPAVLKTTGWMAAIPGHESTVKAAATGFVIPEPGEKPIELGSTVKADQRLAILQVFLSPQEAAQLVVLKEEADILIRQSKTSLETDQARLDRIQTLADAGPIALKEVETARESVEKDRAAYEEAQQQLPFLPSEPYDRPIRLEGAAITAPQPGRLVGIHVRFRQLVIQGDPLWTIADWTKLWLRVPVFEGDRPHIDPALPAHITVPGLEEPRLAKATRFPQPTQEGRRTVDLIYEVSNADGLLRPGQAIAVSLPLGGTREQVVVPRSGVLWDGMGSASVYIADTDHNYRRQRIQVGPSLGDMIVVEQGLSKGQSVVTVGAEALYAEEFKGQIPALEDDD